MHYSIEKIVYYYYQINVLVEYRLEKSCILTDEKCRYVLLEIDKDDEHLLLYQSKYIPKIIPTIFRTKAFKYSGQLFCLYEYASPSDLCVVNQYVSTLLNLNQESLVTQKVNSTFYEEQCKVLRRKIEDSYAFFDNIVHDFVTNKSFNVIFFPLIYEYEIISKLKKTALNFLEEYQKIVLGKDTCRFCLSLNLLNFQSYSVQKNCFTDLQAIKFDLVTNSVIQLFKIDIIYEDLERLYISKFSFEKHEKMYLLIELLCLEIIDFNLDGYKNIVWFKWLKSYIGRLIKIMKSLQIEENIMYN